MPHDTIGIFADSHRTDANSVDRRHRYSNSGPEFYSEAQADIEAACTAFNDDCDAMVQMGDLIDLHSGNVPTNENDTGEQGEVILAAAVADLETYTGPRYSVIGNWDMADYDFASSATWFALIRNGKRDPETITELSATTYNDKDNNPKAARYYAFECPNGAIGIVLDSTGKTAEGAEEYQSEDTTKSSSAEFAYVPATQRTWLAATLAAHTTAPIVIFCHYWLYPEVGGYLECKNSGAVKDILEAYNTARISAGHSGRVVAVFAGHHHPGTESWWRDDQGDDPGDYRTLTDPDGSVFGIEYNSIKYFNLRCPICGWGSDEAGATDDGAGGEATPANVYYKAIIGDFVKDVFDIKVTGFGVNPGGQSKIPKQYLAI